MTEDSQNKANKVDVVVTEKHVEVTVNGIGMAYDRDLKDGCSMATRMIIQQLAGIRESEIVLAIGKAVRCKVMQEAGIEWSDPV